MKNKLLFYLGELLIVIIGVSVAFWLSQIGAEKKEDQIRHKYFSELHGDIAYDLKNLEFYIRVNSEKIEEIMHVVSFYENVELNKDSIIMNIFEIGQYSFFNPRDFTYQSIIASGDFKLIDNPEIKKNLIRLYSEYRTIEKVQNNYLDALDNNFFPYLVENFDYLSGTPTVPDLHKSLMIKNHFLYAINDVSTHIHYYKKAQKIALNLDSLITTELELFELEK